MPNQARPVPASNPSSNGAVLAGEEGWSAVISFCEVVMA